MTQGALSLQEREVQLLAEVAQEKQTAKDLSHQINALKSALERIQKMVEHIYIKILQGSFGLAVMHSNLSSSGMFYCIIFNLYTKSGFLE